MTLPERESAAIVLDCRDYGESDKIVTFLCPEAGRLSGIAKGAKRSKQRFVNKLELFSLLHMTYSLPLRGDLVYITAAELESGFLNLRKSVDLYNAANTIREYILMGVREKECDGNVFAILHWALKALNDRRPSRQVVVIFLLRFFDAIGYRPDFEHCHDCRRGLPARQGCNFNYMAGGLLCPACTEHGYQATVPLSAGTIRLLIDAQNLPNDRLHRLQFSNRSIDESLNLLHHYGRRLFQRDIHSWAMFMSPAAESRAKKPV